LRRPRAGSQGDVMNNRWTLSAARIRRLAPIAAILAVVLVAGSAGQATAQGLFDLFGPRRDPAPAQQMSYAEPVAPPAASARPVSAAPSAGQTVAYCVRLCDGRYFPIQHHSAATAAQLCNSFCPASPAKVFSGGGDISRAVARDGSRYSALENAFVYRTRVVADCTCNGKDSFGVAAVDISADPTVRTGDLVATESGPVAALAAKSKR
jgi:Protein of unknown function (DUF2865)